MTTNTSPKRIVLILGGKGGTGKTLFARLLYFFLIQSGIACLGYDADTENPEFQEYHTKSGHPVQALEFLEVGDAKRFLTELNAQKPEVAILDMPGASGKQTRAQLQKFGIFKIAEQLGYRITVCTVLNNGYNTINSLETMMEFCGDRVDYVVVKSQLWNQGYLNFNRWDTAKTCQKFHQLKGIEIEMPVLDVSTFDELHEGPYSFFEREKLSFGDQILVDSFIDLSRPQVERAATYLGYPTTSPKKKTPETVGAKPQ